MNVYEISNCNGRGDLNSEIYEYIYHIDTSMKECNLMKRFNG